ncbi:MAG: hypothetical protein JSV34_00100 [Candidatus Omnitrophota bacterium]|nr:MAG: hypothetical protein JSV34_00100 [Candidatus Omnitrophota bacterium]
MIHKIALVAAVVLPLWNIPLIMRIVKRKSSKDISLYWVFGVWVCLLIMFPAAVSSTDIVWRTFSIINLILFSCVVACSVLFYKSK